MDGSPGRLIHVLPCQASDNLTNRGFGFGLDLVFGLVLNWVLDVNSVEVGPPERTGLRPRRVHELVCRYRHGCYAQALESC